MTKSKYVSLQAQQILEEDRGYGTISHREIERLSNIILDAEELEEETDLIDPEDSGISLPVDVDESTDAEELYNSMIQQDVVDYTSATLR